MQVQELLKSVELPAGYKYKFTGEDESQKESEEFLSRAFLIALFLIFLILVTLFNSVVQPVIILTSVVLSLGGAFWGLAVINSPFGIIMTGVGIISLAGVVVNNAIVLIDYTNKLRDKGLSIKDGRCLSRCHKVETGSFDCHHHHPGTFTHGPRVSVMISMSWLFLCPVNPASGGDPWQLWLFSDL